MLYVAKLRGMQGRHRDLVCKDVADLTLYIAAGISLRSAEASFSPEGMMLSFCNSVGL